MLGRAVNVAHRYFWCGGGVFWKDSIPKDVIYWTHLGVTHHPFHEVEHGH